jgi:sugar lactone lactonase YvrE
MRRIVSVTGVLLFMLCYCRWSYPQNHAKTLDLPMGVTVTKFGNVFIADTRHYRILEGNAVVAGNGRRCLRPTNPCGDGGPATKAKLNFPIGVAIDSAGNIYIADSRDNRIREVEAKTGIIVTVAGTGAAGFSGDGGPAIQAELNSPTGVAIDLAGNIYIADSKSNRIRLVNSATGIITTIAGNP